MRYLLVSILLFCSVAFAQDTAAISPVIPIADQKRPATIPKPYGPQKPWKLLRVCTAPAGENGATVWLFAFRRRPPIYPKFPLDDIDWLDVTLVIANPLKSGQWRVLRRAPLGNQMRNVAGNFQLRWLQSAQKTGPVLVIDAPLDQKTELIAFATGWSQKPAVRQTYKVWSTASQSGTYNFDMVDENGFLAPTERITNYTDGRRSEGGSELLRWNGHGWGAKGQ